MKQTDFSMSRNGRDSFCREKDAVLIPILERVRIEDPDSFRAVLMPSLYGVEARYLVSKGVPTSNLFAIEDNSVEKNFDTHDEILNCRLPDRQELRGMRTTERPMRLIGALDEAWFEYGGVPFDLIYFDLLSQPGFESHYVGCFRKIVKGRMLKPGGVLIVNFGRARCRHEVAEFNHRLTEEAIKVRGVESDVENAKVLIEAAVQEWDGIPLRCPVECHSYVSGSQTFTTTVAFF